MRAAIRRGILEADRDRVRAYTTKMEDYPRETLRDAVRSVMRKGTTYEREEVIRAVARRLGFTRLTPAARKAIRSAINSAIRQGVIGYERGMIWRE